MSEKDIRIVEFVRDLIKLPQKVYEEVKVTLLSVEVGNTQMTEFLTKAFDIAEKRRPKLLEMKGGVVNA